jgi:DNA-binding transcriptional regulator YiaG
MPIPESAVPEAVADLVSRIQKAKLPPVPRRRRIREAAGVSMREMARTLDVDVMTVARWESGATPRPEHAMVYRQLLDALEAVEP